MVQERTPAGQLAYTVEQASQATQIGINQIRADITAGRLRAKLIGRTKRVIRAEDLLDYLEKLPDASGATG